MKRILVVVDCQNDFIDGSLGTAEAEAIVEKVAEKIMSFDGEVVATYDTHYDDTYMTSNEGRHLPVKHCIIHTDGWQLHPDIEKAFKARVSGAGGEMEDRIFPKETFGSEKLATAIRKRGFDYIEIIGLCTDICVVSNALLIKAFLPEAQIACDFSCCAGVTPELHDAARSVMRSCQIDEV